MRNLSLLIVLSFTLAGCLKNKDDSTDPELEARACRGIYLFSSLKVHIRSADPLPPNLSLAVEEDLLYVDECPNPNSNRAWGGIETNSDRNEISFSFTINEYLLEFWDPHFSDDLYETQFSPVSLRLFSRPECGQDPELLYEIDQQEVTWEPVFTNDRECGPPIFSGSSEVLLESF